MSALLEMKNVCLAYGEGNDKTEVLKDINFTINEGEFVAIVGFSGTGKTTLINLMAGLLEPTSGEILYKGKALNGPSSERGVIFQNYSLLPWLTVGGNVNLAVKTIFPELTAKERRNLVEKYVDMVNLLPAIDKRPKELSGGMRQRVSVARALSVNPSMLLMDEPLSALDALTRAVLQDQILEIWKEEKKTVVLITNDVDEGILMADRIIPLKIGPNAQLGPNYQVELARPRLRKGMNSDQKYKTLRNEVIHYLNKIKEQSETLDENKMVLPDVMPITA
ncbi:MAG: ABC transporter ATP-binding protein [Lentisphaeria bacterium]|nr:ABC transporter ATP-binding protein [Lentisphaeria bacterium]